MPGAHRFGLYDKQRRAPLRPEAGESNPEQSVRGVQTQPAALRSLQGCELVSESQNLDLKRCPSPKPGPEAGKRGKKE
jgi:hypothetical protein